MKYVFALIAIAAAAATAFIVVQLVLERLSCLPKRGRKVSLEEVLSDRWLCFALFAALGGMVAAAVGWIVLVVAVPAALVLSVRAPKYLERQRQQKLRGACDGQLDALADIVAMGTGAGLSFDSAVDLYCSKFDGELSRQLSQARALWASGVATRADALSDMAARVDSPAIRRFADTSSQAIAHGAPLANMLTRFAEELRTDRRASIEQQVAKAPVKMLIPTGLLILPATLLLVMGPALLQFVGSGI